MAHSLQYQIGESARAIESEVGKLLNLAATLRDTGNNDLAAVVSMQAHKLLEAAVALRIAMSD
ncbi:Phosphate transport system regulatory protein PhoU [Pseudomonas sp. IT-P74]